MRPMLLLGFAVALLAGVAPLLSIYGQHVFILVALYGAIALAWNILGGMAGQMSLGHALFVGAGAYVSTALYLDFAVSPWIGLVVAAIIGGALGAGMGYTVFRCRLSGVYFALVTLAVAEMALHIVSNVAVLGGDGRQGDPLAQALDPGVVARRDGLPDGGHVARGGERRERRQQGGAGRGPLQQASAIGGGTVDHGKAPLVLRRE